MKRLALCLALASGCGGSAITNLSQGSPAQPFHEAERVRPSDPVPTPSSPPPAPDRPRRKVARSAPARVSATRAGATSSVRRTPNPERRETGDVWAALARCESGGNPQAHSSSGTYHGAFQFSLSTWRSVGMSGDPHTHSYAEQLAAAKRLQARSGWGQWPACSRKLGLR